MEEITMTEAEWFAELRQGVWFPETMCDTEALREDLEQCSNEQLVALAESPEGAESDPWRLMILTQALAGRLGSLNRAWRDNGGSMWRAVNEAQRK